MKTIDKFILRSFAGPFAVTFFIALFILLMQFLWKYIEDLAGKGLEWYVIAELLMYCSAQLVQLALPLAMLLSSIMLFGNIAERYELAALKASGISLQRVMKPLIILTVALSIGAFLYSNFVLPLANLKFYSLLYDITEQKPAINIKEGIFYNGINDISIRVAKKDKNGKDLYDVMIYDHSERRGTNKILTAKRGQMEMTQDKQYLVLNMFDGESYEEVYNNQGRPDNKHPFVRSKFKEQILRLKLSDFKLQRTDESNFKDHVSMLNIKQLDQQVDTIKLDFNEHLHTLSGQIRRNVSFFKDSVVKYNPDTVMNKPFDVLAGKNKLDMQRIVDNALNIARSNKSYIDFVVEDEKQTAARIRKHQIEWHRKFTLSIACLILFFVGAPLGAIIRKGGFGMPVVVSVLFFILFHVLSISGEKMSKEGTLEPLVGMWMATVILFPVGVFLTYKATTDSSLFDVEFYAKPFKKLKAAITRKKK